MCNKSNKNLENKVAGENPVNNAAQSESGAALVVAIFMLLLLMGFVALAISRTSTETIITNNDVSESRAFAASEAALESATRDFVDVFETKLVPSATDITNVEQAAVPGFGNFNFTKVISKTKAGTPIVLTGGNYGGLYALRDSWEIEALAVDKYTDVKVEARRRFFSDRIPVFQFGVFYDDDLELNRPPLFTFGGRVHTNGSFFVTASNGNGIYFNSKVTAAKEIVNDIWKPGTALVDNVDNKGQVYVDDASGTARELKTGEASVTCVSPSGANVFASTPTLPYCAANPNWNTQKAKFQGNLENGVSPLNLPLTRLQTNLIEIIKRGKNIGDMANVSGAVVPVSALTQDTSGISRERFANKPGIRISLADSQAKLPGCASVTAGTFCGLRMDGPLGTSIGYQPLPMSDGYVGTPLNATRMAINGRQLWIKIELVKYEANDPAPQVWDVTPDILSLGVTEPAPIGSGLQINGYTSTTDTRSVIKLQRFAVDGPNIPDTGTTSYMSNYTIGGKSRNLVVRYNNVTTDPSSGCPGCTAKDSFAMPFPNSSASLDASATKEDAAHLKWADINSSGPKYAIVPFPIKLFDAREGLTDDSATDPVTNFGTGYLPANGAMSVVDIDVANFRRFLMGNFDGTLPTTTPFAIAKGDSLRSSDVPQNAGWVVYVSDRRGDYDFDGEYDMEDVFQDGILQYNEDVNGNLSLDTDYTKEAASYATSVPRGQAASADQLYYRRGVRLINGITLPGRYDAVVSGATKGFTIASENGIYVQGNYNSTGVGLLGGTSVTPPENYFPSNSQNHIPAAVVGDAVMILSNAWTDGNSFANPFSSNSRVASDTQVRFAMISGDAITGNSSIPFMPSWAGQINGGVHNFKRFLESWANRRLNYSGSLINLYNTRNNNGFFKCCTTVYKPPIRDWTFDSTFLDPERLPPGTPYIYSISFTGFQRINN
ncbi:MAG: hypothetical protein OEM82_13895 [Acidobacteriota bacterium]|nr:hypothetical protein [Acidobacteriota bacterium]MDH3528381.1 hypothetical protein [Acidobacteriota bacterium]